MVSITYTIRLVNNYKDAGRSGERERKKGRKGLVKRTLSMRREKEGGKFGTFTYTVLTNKL